MCAIACVRCHRVKCVANILLLTDFKPIRFFSTHFSSRYLALAHTVQRLAASLCHSFSWSPLPVELRTISSHCSSNCTHNGYLLIMKMLMNSEKREKQQPSARLLFFFSRKKTWRDWEFSGKNMAQMLSFNAFFFWFVVEQTLLVRLAFISRIFLSFRVISFVLFFHVCLV